MEIQTEIAKDLSVLGSTAGIYFPCFGIVNDPIEGKVDTGATMSSLDASEITIKGKTVVFKSNILSDNLIMLDLVDERNVLSADGEGDPRPVVEIDIIINGKELPKTKFNLNDRSHMDSPILIGQNIIKAGEFVVDITDEEEEVVETIQKIEAKTPSSEEEIMEAIDVLVKHDVSLSTIIYALNKKAISNIS